MQTDHTSAIGERPISTSVNPDTPRIPDSRYQNSKPEAFEENTGPTGIAGWLILPVLGLVGTVLLTLKNLLEVEREAWQFLFTNTDSSLMHFQVLALLSLFMGFIAIGWAIMCLIQMFRHSPRLPRNMIIFYIGLVVITIFELFLGQYAASITGERPDPMTKEMVRVIIAAAIWIPYFRVSKRVANTFKPKEARVNAHLDNIFS